MRAGSGGWFYNIGASPFLLESVLDDPGLRATTFVLIHGGLPFAQATRVLLGKPKVYADFSSQTFLTSARELSQVSGAGRRSDPRKCSSEPTPFHSSRQWLGRGRLAQRQERSARHSLLP